MEMTDSIRCGECGATLDGLVDPPGGKAACPHCGATRRIVRCSLEYHAIASDHVAMVAGRDGRTFAFRESVRSDGRAASAERQDDGLFAYSISGSSPQNETQTPRVCQLLIRKLNSLGESWSEPSKGEDDSHDDCVATDMCNTANVLRVQVVRAITDKRLSEKWARQGALDKQDVDVSELASQIAAAIEHKVKVKIPRNVRPELTLALDATLLPVTTFDHVIESFRARHGPWADALGFEAIWMVGPTHSLVRRLDLAA
jgi:hypothetical protein